MCHLDIGGGGGGDGTVRNAMVHVQLPHAHPNIQANLFYALFKVINRTYPHPNLDGCCPITSCLVDAYSKGCTMVSHIRGHAIWHGHSRSSHGSLGPGKPLTNEAPLLVLFWLQQILAEHEGGRQSFPHGGTQVERTSLITEELIKMREEIERLREYAFAPNSNFTRRVLADLALGTRGYCGRGRGPLG